MTAVNTDVIRSVSKSTTKMSVNVHVGYVVELFTCATFLFHTT